MPAHVNDPLDEALAAYERGDKISDIEQAFGIDRSTLYSEMRARGRAPTRVQQKRLINRGATDLAREAWERLAVLGVELARATRNEADLAAKNIALLEEIDRLARENATLRLGRDAATGGKARRSAPKA